MATITRVNSAGNARILVHMSDTSWSPAAPRTLATYCCTLLLAGLGASVRIVNLVARHSYAILEADLRGLGPQVAAFPDEGGVLRDALWYCDLTTSPDGEPVAAGDRMAEIRQRYGPGHIVTRFIDEGAPELLAAVERTERRLAGERAS
jgi:hypothetical protein